MKKQNEFKKEELNNNQESQLNLDNLEKIIEDAIQKAINSNQTNVVVSVPSNPADDPGTNIFLISEGRKSFDCHYDPAIIERLKDANYESNLTTRRDSMSGVLHYKIHIKLQ